tara:strand:- start:913 stop:1176 length:264 start_codon:yes stop_codon:yes gene_type:complete
MNFSTIIKSLVTVLFTISLLIFSQCVNAYENNQFNDCIESAQQNKALKGISKEEIENYCDCALDLIIDKKENIRNSGYQCAIENFRQ